MAAIRTVTMKVHRNVATSHNIANVQELHLTAIPVASRIPPNFTQECNCVRQETLSWTLTSFQRELQVRQEGTYMERRGYFLYT